MITTRLALGFVFFAGNLFASSTALLSSDLLQLDPSRAQNMVSSGIYFDDGSATHQEFLALGKNELGQMSFSTLSIKNVPRLAQPGAYFTPQSACTTPPCTDVTSTAQNVQGFGFSISNVSCDSSGGISWTVSGDSPTCDSLSSASVACAVVLKDQASGVMYSGSSNGISNSMGPGTYELDFGWGYNGMSINTDYQQSSVNVTCP